MVGKFIKIPLSKLNQEPPSKLTEEKSQQQEKEQVKFTV